MKSFTSIAISVLVVSVSSISAFGGSLEPAAPPASTMKPLDQVEPRTAITTAGTTISTPGSYYLTKSLVCINNQNGITITCDNVTIDLNGFTLDGSKFAQHGIFASTRTNIVIKNGIVCNWYGFGISLQSCTNCTIENVSFSNTSYSAVIANNATIINCRVSGVRLNSYSAISLSGAGVIKNSVVSDCNYLGISISDRCVVSECTVRNNAGAGIHGANTCVIKDCVISGNTGYGVRAVTGSMVSNCAITNNQDHGIYLDRSYALNNSCVYNGTGNANGAGIFVTGSGCRVEGNTCNTSGKYGFYMSSSLNTVVRNSASGNTTNYSMSGGNIGPIATDYASATNPWSNLSF